MTHLVLELCLPYLSVQDVANIEATSKEYHNDLLWKYYYYFTYSPEFIRKASTRNPLLSRPRSTFKEEIMRLQIFKNELKERLKFTDKDNLKFIECFLDAQNDLWNNADEEKKSHMLKNIERHRQVNIDNIYLLCSKPTRKLHL